MTFLHHASVYLEAPATAPHIVTAANVYEKFLGFTSGGVATGGITADFLNSRIVMSQTGKYLILFRITVDGPVLTEVRAKAYWNATPIDFIADENILTPATGKLTLHCMGVLDAHLPVKDLELWVTADKATTLTLSLAQLTGFFLSTTST